MVGSVLAHYRILEKLGEGGMGAVYKARDSHLDRFVAIKVLPTGKAGDPERRRRFFQEARSASALNHPNIITVYDAAVDAGVDYIAMEYIAGKTLDELIQRKPLKLNEALDYAVQICGALARAHAAGIVHRDLKPSNVMVDDHGLVKVLDFGLAKLSEPDTSGETAATATLKPHTEEGVAMGTAAYMSPEQAEGRPADARSDVFSFGIVLYEMLTRGNPFRRNSRMSTMSAVVNDDPKPLSAQSATMPPELERAVMRCLHKDPNRRWQSMADLKSLLEDLKEESGSSRPAAAPAVKRAAGPTWLALGLGALLLAVAGGLAAWKLLSPGRRGSVQLTRLSYDTGLTLSPSISLDGRIIAYASDRSGEGRMDIWVRHTDSTQPVRRTHDPAGATTPWLSPDGSRIVFRSERDGGGLYLMDTLGGDERKVADEGVFPRFSPNGRWILYTRSAASGNYAHNKMFLIPSKGGDPKPFLPEFGAALFVSSTGPIWSPDSRHILFLGVNASGSSGWWAAPVEGGTPVKCDLAKIGRPLGIIAFPAAWPSPETLVIGEGVTIEGINLHRVRISPGPWTITGPPEALTTGPGLRYGAAAASDGNIVFEHLAYSNNVWSYPLNKTAGEPQPVSSDSASKLGLTASRDGSKVAWVSLAGFAAGRRVEVRVRDVASGKEALLSDSGELVAKQPRLSHDGSLLAYRDMTAEGPAAFVVPSSGGSRRRVCSKCLVLDFFPGNREVLVLYPPGRLVRQILDTGEQTPIVNVKAGSPTHARISSDGRRIAFSCAQPDGGASIRIADVWDGPSPDEVLVDSGGRYLTDPAWSADGSTIYFVWERDGSPCVWALKLDRSGKAAGEPFAVLHAHLGSKSLVGPRGQSALSVAKDRMFLVLSDYSSNVWMLKGLLE